MLTANLVAQWLCEMSIHGYQRMILLSAPSMELLITTRLSASISSLSNLSHRFVAVKLFREGYRKASTLRDGVADPIGHEDPLAPDIKRSLFAALAQKPKRGPLQVAGLSCDLLILEARSHGEPFILGTILPICNMAIRNVDFIADLVSKLHDETDKWVSLSTVQQLTREILTTLAREISDHCSSRSSTTPRTWEFQPCTTDYGSYGAPGSSYDTKSNLSRDALVKLFCHCEKLKLFDCVTMLIQPLLEISQARVKHDLSDFLIPLLKAIASEFSSIQNTIPHYQPLFQQVLKNYVRDFVGKKPLPLTNLTRKGNEKDCYDSYSRSRSWQDCKSCKDLNHFLAAPDRYEWTYKAAEHGRKHIQRRLSGLDCSSFTDKDSGSPHTLIMRKNDASYQEALKDWQRRCSSAQSVFDGIGHQKLKVMLSGDYDDIMQQLSDVTDGKVPTVNRQPLTALDGSMQNRKHGHDGTDDGPACKRSREVEVIDLC